MIQELTSRASRDEGFTCFPAGDYIPAAVWDLASRGEFLTAYPLPSRGESRTLQLIYEYQSMMSTLTALDFSNASVYDGASGLKDQCSWRLGPIKKKSRRVLVSGTVNPNHIKAVETMVNQKIKIDISQIDKMV